MKRWLTMVLWVAALAFQGSHAAQPAALSDAARLVQRDDAEGLGRVLSDVARTAAWDASARANLMALAINSRAARALPVLMGAGIDPNQALSVRQGEVLAKPTPLLLALSGKSGLPTVKALVEGGASVRLASEGLLPLTFAIGLRQFDVAQYLLAQGADASGADPLGGMTPLMQMAVVAESTDPLGEQMARALLAQGADVNARAARGATALRLAASTGRLWMIALLLQSGADPQIRDAKGETVLDHARRTGKTEVLRLLETGGGS